MSSINLIFCFLMVVELTCNLFVDSSSGGRYNRMRLQKQSRFGGNACEFEICEHTDEYPEEHIIRLLEGYRKFDSFFGKVIEPVQEQELSNRFRDDDSPVCDSLTVTKKPTYLTDVNNQTRTIVNVQNRTQIVVYEKCSCPNKQCFLADYNCTQKYNVIGLLAMKGLDELEIARFKIPSTCACMRK